MVFPARGFCPEEPHLGALKGSDCMQDTVRNVDCQRGATLLGCMSVCPVAFNVKRTDTWPDNVSQKGSVTVAESLEEEQGKVTLIARLRQD